MPKGALLPACFVVVLEGIDGAGTSSQLPPLAAHLRRAGHLVACRAQPSRGPIGRSLRRFLTGQLPLGAAAQALLFAADRLALREQLAAQPSAFVGHRRHLGLPPSRRQRVLLLDRDVLSSLAYQGLGLPVPWLQAINRHSPPPQLTLFFRLPARLAASRRRQRGTPAEAFDAAATQARVAGNYERALTGAGRRGRLVVIDARPPLAEVTEAVCAAVDAAMAAPPRRRR